VPAPRKSERIKSDRTKPFVLFQISPGTPWRTAKGPEASERIDFPESIEGGNTSEAIAVPKGATTKVLEEPIVSGMQLAGNLAEND
jgi:hypothetical protein